MIVDVSLALSLLRVCRKVVKSAVKVDSGGQENPCHLPEERLREVRLVTVLEEPLTLVRVRRDLVVHDVGYLSEQLSSKGVRLMCCLEGQSG